MAVLRCGPGTRVPGVLVAVCGLALFLSACSLRAGLDNASPQALGPHDVELASSRVAQRVPSTMLANVTLFLYVNKAASGPLAQHMIVFEKGTSGLAPIYAWSVSTGREDMEADAHGRQETTVTPEGIYPLDPKRIYASHESSEWDEEMPYAMFLADQSAAYGGLAIHAATGDDVGHIGSRASAGCIRLAPENAHTLFDLVRARLAVPAQDASRKFVSHGGRSRRLTTYPIVVVIDDYPGETLSSTTIRVRLSRL